MQIRRKFVNLLFNQSRLRSFGAHILTNIISYQLSIAFYKQIFLQWKIQFLSGSSTVKIIRMLAAQIVFVLCAILILQSESARILGLFTRFSRSHLIVHLSIAKALIDKGHDVTLVTTVPLPDKNSKYKHILLEPFDDDIKGVENMYKMSKWNGTDAYVKPIVHITRMQYKSMRRSELQQLLNTTKFDLLLLGSSMNEFQLAIAAQLKVPVILSWVIEPAGIINTYAGNPNEVSYVPFVWYGYKQPMNFKQRFVNFIHNLIFYGLETFIFHKHGEFYE